MYNTRTVGQTYNTFYHLISELEPFVETQELRLSFDAKGHAFLTGPGFCEELQADPKLYRKVREEMREIIARHASRRSLPKTERLSLIQTLNALPGPQFDELLFALKPPSANVPGNAAPQGNRSIALLEWIESPIGPGLTELEAVLESIVTTQTSTTPQANEETPTVEALKDIIKTLAANQAPKYDMRGAQFSGGFAESVEGNQISNTQKPE